MRSIRGGGSHAGSLENAFRNFNTLTQGDIVSISYNKKTFDILIMEIKPSGKGISILETDLEVDFAPPLGYVEPVYNKPSSATVGQAQPPCVDSPASRARQATR